MRKRRDADVLLIITQHRIGRRRCCCLEVRALCCGADNDSCLDSSKPSTPTMLQLLARCCVPEVLRLCHIGTVGGHFGGKKTMVQAQRWFYLATWKTDIRRYSKICSECSTYRRGKPSRQSRLNRVYGTSDILFGNADDAYAPTIDYDDSVTQTRSRITESCVEVYETLRRSAEQNMQYCIVRVKPFTAPPPTSWNVSSSGLQMYPTYLITTRLQRKLKRRSRLIPVFVVSLRMNPRRRLHRRKCMTPTKNQSGPGRVGPSEGQDGSIIDKDSGCEIDDAISDGKGSLQLPTLLANVRL